MWEMLKLIAAIFSYFEVELIEFSPKALFQGLSFLLLRL